MKKRLSTCVPLITFPMLLGFLLTACSGPGSAEATIETGQRTNTPAAGAETWDQLLPSPSALSLPPPSDRQASYAETDYINHGSDYLGGLAHQKVGMSCQSAKFSTSWSPPDDSEFANLGFCIYRFQNLSGYSRAPEVRYGFNEPPEDINTAWLGLADWDHDRWEWHRCNAAGRDVLTTLAPYTNSTDHMYVVVLMANAEVTRLRWIRLGPVMVNAELDLFPNHGITSLTVQGNAGCSTTDVGTLDHFKWDWDDDGVFEHDSGSTATHTHGFSAPGEYLVHVRVCNNYDEFDTASAIASAIGPWEHSWGLGETDYLYGAATDGESGLYFTGYTESATTGEDLLLLKYDLQGNFEWAKSWPGSDYDSGADIVYANGGLYVTGITSSFGAGIMDVLLQRWDLDGNLEWTHTWGEAGNDIVQRLAYSDDMLYAAGRTESFTHPNGDALLLKYDTTGAVQWARALGDTEADSFNDIDTTWIPLPSNTTVHLVGSTRSYSGSSVNAAMYARFAESGALTALSRWTHGTDAYGNSISAYGMLDPEVYITAELAEDEILLSEVGTDPGLFNKKFMGTSFISCYDMLRLNDNYIQLCGSSGFGATDGLLVSVSLDDSITTTETWDAGGDTCSLNFLQPFPGNGILTGGYGGQVVGGSWSTAGGSLGATTGSWTNLLLPPVEEPTGVVNTPTLAAVDITTGVHDTGGGGNDALIIARDPL